MTERGLATGAVQALLDEDLNELYEHAPAGYVSALPDGIIVRVNKTFCAWTGFTPEGLAGRRFYDLFSVPGRVYWETHLRPLLAMQGSLNEIALDLPRADGTILPVLVNAARKSSAQGEPLVDRYTVFNATDRRRYERQLLEARRLAESEAQAKTDLLAMLSHDIRTPLGSIMAVAAILERSGLGEEQRAPVRILKSAAASLLRLVDGILETSRIEAGAVRIEARPIDLRAAVRELAAGLQPLADAKGIALEVHLDERLPALVVADPVKIGQVLGNLLGNALKFTEKGSVRVEVAVLQEQAQALDVRVRVIDTGIGIAAEELPRIFDEFSQANETIGKRFGGSGLGLSISRKLLQALGSKLEVTSRPGEGSQFWFDLRLERPA